MRCVGGKGLGYYFLTLPPPSTARSSAKKKRKPKKGKISKNKDHIFVDYDEMSLRLSREVLQLGMLAAIVADAAQHGVA